jgi:DNA-directed RNA polymerase specialized sigma24 family protein
LLNRWLSRYDVQPSDADDLIREVMTVVMQELPQFDHSGQTGAFRNLLREVPVNRLRTHWRTRKYESPAKGTKSLLDELNQLTDDYSEASRIWNDEHERHVISQLMESVQ